MNSLQGPVTLLQVFDMPVSIRFYRDILGFEIVEPNNGSDDVDWVLMKCGSYELMLNTAYEKPHRPSSPEAAKTKIHGDISLFFGHENIDDAYNYLKNKDVQVSEPYFTGYGWRAIHFQDPDGYGICIHRPV